MGRGEQLSEYERGQIEVYRESGLSHHKIAQKIGRSQNVVSNFLGNKAEYGKNMKGGVKHATSAAVRRHIVLVASNSHLSAPKIKEICGVTASVSKN
ncbi:uncharacterized protein LOC120773838 [Bactrocera tryoni]|uniref:uncharacterized protein LOC120773838 n=1 Tax=Bactrocera tryoni TaxID=59916 RepID=UPI001A9882AB|nr:uncharacterized protein LOC120773838 [Bactrocera tryoni]